MAKAKQRSSSSSSSASASRRREEVRKQRQQQQTPQSPGNQNKRYRKSSSNRNTQIMVGVVLLAVAVAIGIFVYLSRQSASTGSVATPVTPSVFNAVTNVSPSILASVGTGGQQKVLTPVKGAPPLKGPSGKPEFFYAGGEFCPFCAAERWAMVVALSRFGTLSHLGQIQSSESNISTFTFYQSTYTSQYIDFVPVETAGMDQTQTLQALTADQQKLFDTYDAPPYLSSASSIPFIDIANQRVMQGANYSPQDLVDSSGASLSWTDIAGKLSDPNSTIAKDILGSANYLTAAICNATNQQPSSVCSAAPIPQIAQSLGATAYHINSVQPGFFTDAVLRKPE